MVATLLLLSGCTNRRCIIFCHNQTEIQSGYVVARDECQDTAQDIVSYSSNVKSRNESLLEAFAKCMKNEGWGVTSPKKTNSQPGGPNDNSQLSGNPWDPSPYGIQRGAPQAIQQQQPYPAQQAYGYPPQQAYGYAQPMQQGYPVQQPSVQQRIYQNYGYTNSQSGYNPYAQGAPAQQNYGYPAIASPAPEYGYAPQQSYAPSYGGEGYGAGGYGGGSGGYVNPDVIAPNRAGIGIAPGFAN